MRGSAYTAVLFWALLSAAGSVCAGSFSVNPIRLEMRSGQSSTSLVVSNHGLEPSLLQVRLYRWTHAQQQEQLSEPAAADAPIITPPLFRLAGGGASQIIRIGFVKPMRPDEGEVQWRVVVEEVPQPQLGPNPALPAEGAVAVNMRLRVSLPLFRLPLNTRQDLQWKGIVRNGVLQLQASNRGSVTERIDELTISPTQSAPTLARLSGPIYLFPGEQRQWSLDTDTTAQPGSLQLTLSGTPLQRVSVLQDRAQ